MNQITIFAQSAQRNRAPKTPATKTAEQEPVQPELQTHSERPVDKSPPHENPDIIQNGIIVLLVFTALVLLALIGLLWKTIRNFFKKRPGKQGAPKNESDETPDLTPFDSKNAAQASPARVAPPPPAREGSSKLHALRSENNRLESEVKDLESQLTKKESELRTQKEKASRNDEASIQKKIDAARREERENAENKIDKLEENLRRMNAELAAAKAETRSTREAGEKALRDEQARSREALDDARRAHASKLAALNAEHANETAALKDLHEKDLRRMDAEVAAAKAETRSAREDGEKALREARERARRGLEAAEQTHAREISAKNAEIARIEKACAEVLSRFWPDASGGNAELAPIFGGWVSEMRDAPEVSAPVMGMLSQLFAWKVAVASGSTVKDQIEALAGFSRHFFRWCEAQGKAPAEARALAAKFAEAFNASVLPEGGAAYKIFVPEVETSYFAKQMCPSTNGAKVGTVSRIETWGVADAKGGTLRRADVVLR